MVTFEVFFRNLSMTVRTIDSGDSLTRAFMLGVDIGMTFHTRNVPVLGILKNILIHCHGNLFTVDNLNQIRFFMTSQTFLIRGSYNQTGSFDLMGMVTICTGWNCTGLFFPEFPSNDLSMNFLDPGVTLSAGAGNISG